MKNNKKTMNEVIKEFIISKLSDKCIGFLPNVKYSHQYVNILDSKLKTVTTSKGNIETKQLQLIVQPYKIIIDSKDLFHFEKILSDLIGDIDNYYTGSDIDDITVGYNNSQDMWCIEFKFGKVLNSINEKENTIMNDIINTLKQNFIKVNATFNNYEDGTSYTKDVFINPKDIISITEFKYHSDENIYDEITLTTGETYFVKK